MVKKKTTAKRSARTHQVDHIIETILEGRHQDKARPQSIYTLAQELAEYDCSSVRVVVLGGGTGLSTVVGGNPQLPDWPDNPFVGLKQLFPLLQVIVCSTDDGLSTGLLLKHLPLIGIGDVRKLCVSLMLSENLEKTYGVTGERVRDLVRLIHGVFNHRFPEDATGCKQLADPLSVVPKDLRRACPVPLKDLLCRLGGILTPRGKGPTIKPGGHALGNLLLTAAILKNAGCMVVRPPGPADIRSGLDLVARAIGVTPGRIHPATATPGQLVIRYQNGVEVQGQYKATIARRGVPVEKMRTEYYRTPFVSAAMVKALREADLIVYAPGSLYTSILPILQLQPLVDAIRSNRKALKILGANFWVQEGETDISLRAADRGFRVSELIEAYDYNVPRGSSGLFDVVLSTNLAQVPASILRNYALEGKRPIYLDRQRIKAWGFRSFEAIMFSMKRLRQSGIIHHDPEKFALAVRTLFYARRRLGFLYTPPAGRVQGKKSAKHVHRRCPLLCRYLASMRSTLAAKHYRPSRLYGVLADLAWENRDMHADHLQFFQGARIIPAHDWGRSTEWDNVLGYYDPQDNLLKIHEQATADEVRLRANLLIALGESLLGRYRESFRWIESDAYDTWGLRSYEIRLWPDHKRTCYLSREHLHRYLLLARMVPCPHDPLVYKMTFNDAEAFLPPGLLFGLMYAWYLNNAYSPIMENEMSLLHWKSTALIPYHVQERQRKQALIDFFRKVVFGYPE